jgi:hypothetical protein
MIEIDLSPQVGDLSLRVDLNLHKKFVKVCWRCGKEGNFKKQCRSKSIEKVKGYEGAPSTEEKTSKEEGGDVYLSSSITHVDHEAWLVESGASFHMTPHREWFCEYERYDGGNVFLGDESTTKIIGRGKFKLRTHRWKD